jgi:hypothetical protein
LPAISGLRSIGSLRSLKVSRENLKQLKSLFFPSALIIFLVFSFSLQPSAFSLYPSNT